MAAKEYAGSRLQKVKRFKEAVVTELFTTTVIAFDAKKSVCCSSVLVVTELFVSGTQCSSTFCCQ